MTSRKLSLNEVLELLNQDDEEEEFFEDTQEVLREGSDEEFDAEEMEDSEDGDFDDLQGFQSGMLWSKLVKYSSLFSPSIDEDMEDTTGLPPPLPQVFLTEMNASSTVHQVSNGTSTSNTIPSPMATTTPTIETTTLTLATTTLPSTTSSVDTPWSTNLTTPSWYPFTGQSSAGLNVPIPETPSECFRLFYTSDLVRMIVKQSNLYAQEVMSDERYEKWDQISIEDLEAYFGFNILMGINSLPSLEDYWKKDPVYHYAPVADCISRDRFSEISRYLHFVDNSTLVPRTSPAYDRLGKIRPLLNHILSRFSAVYTPGQDLAVDEAMIKFQGRSSMKQYMPIKPIKRGIKVWVLADSTNGYFSRLEIYTGKKVNSIEHNLGSRVVKDLTSDFQNKWHHVFFDNLFTSKALMCDLEAVGLYGCGTARKDRKGFPVHLKKAKLHTR